MNLIGNIATFIASFFYIYTSVTNWEAWSEYRKAMHTVGTVLTVSSFPWELPLQLLLSMQRNQ